MKVGGASAKRTAGDASAPVSGGKSGAKPEVGAARAAAPAFMEVVDDIESQQLLAELDEVGTQLTRHPTTVLMGRYRELVRLVLEKVKGGMRIRRDFKWRRTERSMFVTIERAEGLIEDLEEALFREGDRVRSLSLIDEIKGCLISLLF